MKSFYIVWDQYSSIVPYQYPDEQSALKESKRLALLCPDKNFVVMKAVCGFVTKTTSEYVSYF